MNTWAKVTAALLVCTILALVLYDIPAAMYGGYHATISYTVLSFGTAHPIFPFALGVLVGHFFWPQEPVK